MFIGILARESHTAVAAPEPRSGTFGPLRGQGPLRRGRKGRRDLPPPARACAACAKAPTALLPGGKCKLCTAASNFAASGHVTFQVRPTAAEFRRGVEWGTTTGASMAHCFLMVRLKTAKEVWCIYLLVRFVLFRRYGIIAALLEPAKRGLTARAVAQRAAAALLQVLGRRGRSVGGRLSE